MTTDTIEAAEPRTALAEYDPIAAGLAELRHRYGGVAFDLATTKGNTEARAARKELVTLRTSLEAKRKELKAPALERSRLIDSEAKRITEAILELETPIDDAIRADEQRREAARQAKAEAERHRVQALQRRVSTLAAFPVRAMGEPAAAIEALIAELDAVEVNAEGFAELAGEAGEAKQTSLMRLRAAHAAAVTAEERAAALAAQHAELARQRAELRRQQEDAARERAVAEAAAQAAAEESQRRERAEREAAEAEAARQRKAAEEEANRQRWISAWISDITAMRQRAIGLPSTSIAAILGDAHAFEVPAFAVERADECAAALAEVIKALRAALEAQSDLEAEQARIAAERAELERQQKALAEERAAAEAKARAEAEAAERERQAAEQARLDAGQAADRRLRDHAHELAAALTLCVDVLTRADADSDEIAPALMEEWDLARANGQAALEAAGVSGA